MMYEELVKRLQDFAAGTERDKDAQLAFEAVDAIEELQKDSVPIGDMKMILEEITNPYWIPVTERLPDEGKFILVYGDLYPNKHDGGSIAVSKRMDCNYWQGFGRERNITHWMPLPSAPEPPKEET